MDSRDEQYEELRRNLAALSERVHTLEQAADLRARPPASPPAGLAAAAPRNRLAQSRSGLESRIGGQWLNRVGIVAVLVGVSYFLKYAFDNEWIGPAGRLLAGLGSGLGVVFWSEYIRRRGYEVYSHSLKAVGIGVLYLSLWAASQLYALVPNGLAFFAMAMVTAATAGMAVWQSSEVIAAFAVLGGLITPAVLATGENHALGLFSYLAVLALGVLFMARYRPWPRVVVESYAGTLLLYAGWHDRFYSVDQFPGAAGAVSVFFAIYLLVPFLGRSSADDALLVLVVGNAAVYFLEMYELFTHAGSTAPAAGLALALAVVYFFSARLLQPAASRLAAPIHQAIAACFLIVAVPVGLDTKWITIGWLVLAGALMWVKRRPQTGFLKYPVAIALLSGLFRLLFVDRFAPTRPIFNERILTYAVAIAVLVLVGWLLAQATTVAERRAAAGVSVLVNVLALLALNHEITDAWRRQSMLTVTRDFAYSALWMVYGAGLMFAGFWRKSWLLRWQALILIGATAAKVFVYDTAQLGRGYRIFSMIALGLLLLATSFFYQRATVSRR